MIRGNASVNELGYAGAAPLNLFYLLNLSIITESVMELAMDCSPYALNYNSNKTGG